MAKGAYRELKQLHCMRPALHVSKHTTKDVLMLNVEGCKVVGRASSSWFDILREW